MEVERGHCDLESKTTFRDAFDNQLPTWFGSHVHVESETGLERDIEPDQSNHAPKPGALVEGRG